MVATMWSPYVVVTGDEAVAQAPFSSTSISSPITILRRL
jgi:hypothetical protein